MEEAFEKSIASNELAQRGELFLLPIDLFVVDVQDRATCYFFEVFDWVGASTLVEGSFDYQRDSSNAPLGEQALLAGITAVGKACLANLQQSNTLRESASDDYVATLNLVNTALGDNGQLNEDATWIAIFLLSIFEVSLVTRLTMNNYVETNILTQIIVGQEMKSIDNWMSHVIGAIKLLDSRGRDTLSKTSSPEMFYCWRNAMVKDPLNCILVILKAHHYIRSFAVYVANYLCLRSLYVFPTRWHQRHAIPSVPHCVTSHKLWPM